MTPSEHLKEIEDTYYDVKNEYYFKEMEWLINRVKHLTEALESAEERLYLIWLRDEDFDTEEVKNEIFNNAYQGREDARKALSDENVINKKTMSRFFSKVKKTNSCWVWTTCKSEGYGKFTLGNKNIYAHRFSLLIAGQTIPKNRVVDHICRNRACVNPRHLRIVTHKQNSIENSIGATAINKAKTHCKHGHEFTKENIIKIKNGRRCRACEENRWRLRNIKRKSERSVSSLGNRGDE